MRSRKWNRYALCIVQIQCQRFGRKIPKTVMTLLAKFLQPPDEVLIALWKEGCGDLELCLLDAQTLSIIPCFEFHDFDGVTLEISPDNKHVAVVAEHAQHRACPHGSGDATRTLTLFMVNLSNLSIKMQLDILLDTNPSSRTIRTAWHPNCSGRLVISDMQAAVALNLGDTTLHQVTLEHAGNQLWGDLLSLQYNLHGQTLIACCSAGGWKGMYILANETLDVLELITFNNEWISDAWWFSDTFGAFRSM
jgi:hypothetical protein